MSEPSRNRDYRMVQGCLNGSEEAKAVIATWIDTHVKACLGWMNHASSHPLSTADLDDAIGEASQTIWKKLPTFEGQSFRAWVSGVCHFVFLRALRKRKADRLILTEAIEVVLNPEYEEEDGDIDRWVRHLPERQRQVVILHVVSELPLAKVAKILGIGLSTVETHWKRARKDLARLLRKEGVT